MYSVTGKWEEKSILWHDRVNILNNNALYISKYRILIWCRQLTPVILTTQKAEIRRITVRSQPGQIV
jgi:hypothetical protein